MKIENSDINIDSDKTKTVLNMLHAMADGQLDPSEREQILSKLEKDTELRADMCHIYRIKNLVQTAYPIDGFEKHQKHQTTINNNPPMNTFAKKTLGKLSIAKAASYLLAFGLIFSAGYITNAVTNPLKENAITLANTPVQKNKVILFLSSSEPEKFIKALTKAESYAQKFANTDGKVYVVTSAKGVDLLRSDTSPHKQQIKALTTLYPALNFVACNNSLYHYEKAGKSTELIDSAQVAPSAVEFVVDHLQRGWRYIAI